MKDKLTCENIQENLAEAKKGQDGSIVAFFDCKGKGKVKYMLQQHTYEEAWLVLDIIQAMVSLLTEFIVWNMSVGVPRA